MIDKVYSGQSGEETLKAKFGRFLNVRAFVGLYHSPTVWICSPTWKFFNLILFGFLWRLHHVGIDSVSKPFPLHGGQTVKLKVTSF